MQYLTIKGKASGKIKSYPVSSEDFSLTLLQFCQKYQIPMASSCNGDGVCKKCVFDGNKLGCQAFMKDLIGIEIEIDYL